MIAKTVPGDNVLGIFRKKAWKTLPGGCNGILECGRYGARGILQEGP